jgi:precorrin-3B C17-methyltransferase
MTTLAPIVVVGVGPGDGRLLTPQAHAAIAQAEVVIAYEGYFEWIAELVADKERIALALGQETERAEQAVTLARRGRRVCVVSSGDPGIYGMASLVLETAGTQGPEVFVVPGISAVNAAASLLGAPLGHDFAVISLSDLLTPWELIERRLVAASEADFVVALLNPCSRRRDWQFGRARDILLRSRPPETPAGVVRHAYRPGQSIERTTLGGLAAATVDMFSTVIVGNASTRRVRDSLVTPRGYARLRSEPC